MPLTHPRNNIIALLETQLDVQVVEIYIDAQITNFHAFREPFAAIMCGPGPGHPSNADEIDLTKDAWGLTAYENALINGVCPGFQSLFV